MNEFKPYMRAPIVVNGKLKVRFEETSNNILSMVKLETPFIIPEIARAGTSVRQYIKLHSSELAKMPDPYKALTLHLRNTHPALNGKGEPKYFLSDAGFRELIDRVWWGAKSAAADLYDVENERAADNSGVKFSGETSKTYRKQSKPATRQNKQALRGRPRKNPGK